MTEIQETGLPIDNQTVEFRGNDYSDGAKCPQNTDIPSRPWCDGKGVEVIAIYLPCFNFPNCSMSDMPSPPSSSTVIRHHRTTLNIFLGDYRSIRSRISNMKGIASHASLACPKIQHFRMRTSFSSYRMASFSRASLSVSPYCVDSLRMVSSSAPVRTCCRSFTV